MGNSLNSNPPSGLEDNINQMLPDSERPVEQNKICRGWLIMHPGIQRNLNLIQGNYASQFDSTSTSYAITLKHGNIEQSL